MAAAPAGTHAGTEAPGHGGGGSFPPFASETFASQLIWFAIAFGVLYWLMSRMALPRVAGVLHGRSQRIARDLDEAQALKTQSEQAGAAYQRALAEARDRAKAIAQETRERLGAESDARRKALEADLAARLAQSEAALRTRTQDAMANVRGIATDAAAAIVERLTGRAPNGAAIQAAVDRTLRA